MWQCPFGGKHWANAAPRVVVSGKELHAGIATRHPELIVVVPVDAIDVGIGGVLHPMPIHVDPSSVGGPARTTDDEPWNDWFEVVVKQVPNVKDPAWNCGRIGGEDMVIDAFP